MAHGVARQVDDQGGALGERRLAQRLHIVLAQQATREALLQDVDHATQLPGIQVPIGWERAHQGAIGIDETIEIGPGQQVDEVVAAFEGLAGHLLFAGTLVQAPHGLVLRLALEDGQTLLGQVAGDTRVDEFHLAGLALEGHVQLAAEQVHVRGVDHHVVLVLAPEARQGAVAAGEFLHQGAPFLVDLVVFPGFPGVQFDELGR